MKRASLLLGLAVFVLVGWQRWKIQDLAGLEAHLLATPPEPCSQNEHREETASHEPQSTVEPMADAELPALLATLRGLEGTFSRTPGDFDAEVDRFRIQRPDLMAKMRRLNSAQATALFADWMGEERDPRSQHSQVVSRMALIFGLVNPGAALEIAANKIKGVEVFYRKIFENWFLENPKALSKWADEWRARTGQIHHPEFARAAATWAALARSLEDPVSGAKEFAKVCDLPSALPNGLRELGSKLETHAARLDFLRSLHAATDGRFVPDQFVIGVAKRTSFAQLSQLLDEAPAYPREGAKDRFPTSDPPPNLRRSAAEWSQDSSPKTRWDWLAQRPEDIPEGRALKLLVEGWARSDDAGTAEWLASLKPGPTRDFAEKRFAEWRRINKPRKR
jgi:hypothetical protein